MNVLDEEACEVTHVGLNDIDDLIKEEKTKTGFVSKGSTNREF